MTQSEHLHQLAAPSWAVGGPGLDWALGPAKVFHARMAAGAAWTQEDAENAAQALLEAGVTVRVAAESSGLPRRVVEALR